MRSIILTSVSLLIGIAFAGCQASDATVTQSETTQGDHDHGAHDHSDHDHSDHDHEGHDHEGHDHGEHDHREHAHGEPKEVKTYEESVAGLVATHDAIAKAFTAGNAEDAHGPLHDIGNLLGSTETLVQASDIDDDDKTKINEAIEQLFEAYMAVDDKLHDATTGKDYSDVSDQIEIAITTLKAHSNSSRE